MSHAGFLPEKIKGETIGHCSLKQQATVSIVLSSVFLIFGSKCLQGEVVLGGAST